MPQKKGLLKVRETGDVTIVGFVNQQFLGDEQAKKFAAEVAVIIQQHNPSVLQFDLTGVALITSEMLGHFLALRNDGIDVVLYNPGEDVRQVVRTTRLDTLFNIVDAQE